MTKLSHSAKDKIMTCGALYKYHYIDRLRPNTVSSALFFGKALDEAFSALLMRKMTPMPPSIPDPLETFKKHFTSVNINGEEVPVTDIRCVYFKGDLNPELCSNPERAEFLCNNRKILEGEMLQEFNNLAVESLTNKATMMIEAYEKEVLPQIERVYSLQEEVNLPNEEGDVIVGFIDFVCSFVDEPGVMYIVDNKTSSKNYKEDSVRTSEQLATYCDYKLIDKAAYVVINKTLKKKEPRVGVQIVRDTIPDDTFKKVFDTYHNALYTIREGKYYKNYSSGCFFYGSPCVYYRYCKSNGKDTTGLVKLKGENDEAN
jgi:hypothetical protein